MITINLHDLFYHRPVTNVHTPNAVWMAPVKIEGTNEKRTKTLTQGCLENDKLQHDRSSELRGGPVCRRWWRESWKEGESMLTTFCS